MQKQTIIILIIGIIVIAAVVVLAVVYGGNSNSSNPKVQSKPPKEQAALGEFAQCLADNDATFYGAFWCPHCNSQKEMFGSAVDKLPYQECSKPNRQQNATCNQENIQSYPTWEFADGSRQTGVLTLEELSNASGCELPEAITQKTDSKTSATTSTANEG